LCFSTTKALGALRQKVKSFILEVGDFVRVELLGKQEAFRVLKRVLNFPPQKPFKNYSQVKLLIKREAQKISRQANEMPLDSGTAMVQ
jgi:hypothetical protein